MSKESKTELKDLEQPVQELTPEQAEQVEGGIIIIGGKPLMTAVNPLSQVSLTPQVTQTTFSG